MSIIAKTQKELADSIGIGERTFAAWLKEGCPGEPKNYVIRDVVEWAKVNKWFPSSDPMLAGGDSDNLERYRGVKADLAEIDLQERKGVLIDPDKVRDVYVQSLRFIRDAAEQIDRQFGNEAFLIISEAWDRAEKYTIEELADDE
ncbi:hypothetical protein [uncultured Gimesia sp.]|uniref:hypothetical protein n=1 Tax=uncultured Gimesia sp. TaxID=1678688 RepID=UPI002610B200|nr:hypothetical protein [uncultured Gimesia sp.]